MTPGAFVGGMAAGVFAVDANGMHNGQVTAPGWVLARQFTGPVTSLTVNAGGTGYANYALGAISNGTTNATFYVSTNSTGGVTSLTVVSGGAGFINASTLRLVQPANGIATFTISAGGSGYANGELLTVSGTGAVNASAAITTNATGGITGLTFVAPGYAGRGFANTTNPVVSIATANGTSGNVAIATLGAGSGLTVSAALGGRAGRVTYETLVAMQPTVTSNSALFNA